MKQIRNGISLTKNLYKSVKREHNAPSCKAEKTGGVSLTHFPSLEEISPCVMRSDGP